MTDRSRTVAHPGLDGLRGLAVAAVLLYHAGFGWARGGYLGVSVFFTLSGYLITSLLLGEHERTGGISLVSFWRRRFRRLIPASVAALAGICVFGATVATPSQRSDLAGDVLAGLLGVANWRFVLQDVSYGDLFAEPSPVLHFWSLAIEMQFYVVFPPLVAAALLVGRGRRRAVAGLVCALIAASLGLTWALGTAEIDRIYFGTATRAAELLVGALLAVVLVGRHEVRSPGVDRALDLGGLGAIVVLGVACSQVAQDSEWLYRGGFSLIAIISALAVVALARASWLGDLVGSSPLRWLGLRSYAIYLYHWPLYLWLTDERTGLDPVPLLALRLVVTFVLAEVSHHLVEAPFRRGSVPRRTLLVAAPAAIASVVAASLVLSATAPAPALVFREEVEAAPDTAADLPAQPSTLTVIGGELAARLSGELTDEADPNVTEVVDATVTRCSSSEAGEEGREGVDDCAAVEAAWREAAADSDTLVVLVGPEDPLADDPAALARVRDAVPDGSEVVWVTHPLVGSWAQGDATRPLQPSFGVAPTEEVLALAAATTTQVEALAANGSDRVIDLFRNLEPPPVGDPPVRVDAVLDADDVRVADALAAVAGEILADVDAGPSTVRILFAGDSIGQTMAAGFVTWAQESGQAVVWDVTRAGCSWVADGESDMPLSQSEGCLAWPEDFERYVTEFDPDLILVQEGTWDLRSRRLSGDSDNVDATDPRVVEALESTYRGALGALQAGGGQVVWFEIPCFGASIDAFPNVQESRRVHDGVLARLADELDGVHVVDLDELVCPGGTYTAEVGGIGGSRPDEVHFSPAAARWLAGELVPLIADLTGLPVSDG